MEQLERIQKIGKHLNKYSQVLARAQEALAELERCQSDYIQLRDSILVRSFLMI